MNDATQKMLTTLGASLAKNLLMIIGTSLAAHGILSTGSGVETFVAVGMTLVGVLWSFWNSYGKAILLSKLEVWKAKSLAEAAKLQAHDIAPPTNEQIAAQSPTATTADVVKVMAADATKIAAVLLLACLLVPSFAYAQLSVRPTSQPRKPLNLPIDPLGLNKTASPSGSIGNILAALDAKLLPDLQYALNLALASGSKVTAPCYQAWINIIETRQKANVDASGTPLVLPDPRLITDFEKAVELRNALQPDSDFMIKCSPVASMVRKDIVAFIGIVLSGGAGLATLVPGL